MKNGKNHPSPDDVSCEDVRVPKCEVIHISIVCANYKATRILVTMLKSIFFYRQNRLHLHLLVDDIAHKILKKLFETWDISLGKYI